jgi:hypothetical protein
METKLTSALHILNRLIDDGVEFPDAEHKVTRWFSLSDSQITQLRHLYDEQ